MKPFYHILVLVLCVFQQTLAQPPARKAPIVLPELNQMSNLHESRLAFDTYRLNNDLSNKGGWKWAKRQEHELLKRIDLNGKMPSGMVYLDALDHIEGMKTNNPAARVSDPGWSPIGPYGNDKMANLGRINCIAFHPTDAQTYYVGFGQGGIWKTTNGGTSYTPLTDNLPMLRISGITIDPNNPETVYATLGDMEYIGYDLYTADRKRATHYGIGLYKSTDGGKSWKATGLSFKQTDFTGSLLRKVLVNTKNSQEIVVTGSSGIYKSKDGGTTFIKKYDNLASDLKQDPANSNTLYATGMYVHTVKQGKANILKSLDFGETWAELNTGIEPQNAQRIEIAISALNPNYLFAIVCDLNSVLYGFYRSKDAGKTWTLEASRAKGSFNLLGNGFRVIYPNSSTEAQDYSSGQGIYDMTILPDPTNVEKVYVGGLTYLITEDGGAKWLAESIYGATTHADVHFLAYNPLTKLFYNCNDGGLFTTNAILPVQKTVWKIATEGINTSSFYRLSSSAINDDIVAGAQDNNSILKRNGTWQTVFDGDGMECILYPDGKDMIYGSYQYGNIGILFKSTSSGKLDSTQTAFTPGAFNEIAEWTTPYIYDATNKEVIVGAGNVYRIPLGGAVQSAKKISNFTKNTNFAAPNQCTALAISNKDANTIYAAKMAHPTLNVKAELYKTNDNGTNWTSILGTLPAESYISYLAADNTDAKKVWATFSNFTDGQKIFASTDGGTNWTNISYNLPNLPANCVTFDEQTGIVYVGMDMGIYYLLPNQKAWQPFVTNLPNVIVNELEINPKSRKLLAATFGRGLWASDLFTITATEPIYQTEIVVFPNPNQGELMVKMANVQGNITLKMVDILGKTSCQIETTGKELNEGKLLNINALNAGMYFLQAIQDNKTKVVKVVKL